MGMEGSEGTREGGRGRAGEEAVGTAGGRVQDLKFVLQRQT